MLWLIAEDEADILNLMATMCQIWGHSALTFENGQNVWNWLDTLEQGAYQGPVPDFVLMDIRMPGKRGNDVANRMRKIAALQHVPIALMTAYSLSPHDRTVIMQTDGVDQIISKPLPAFDELHSLLHQIIDQKDTPNGLV